jgi:hypothetical protein
MQKKVSSIDEILAALPAAQKAVRTEIEARIDAGEDIASMGTTEMRDRSKALLESLRPNKFSKKSAA